MPIVVVILGVIIIALGAAVFLVPKPAETPTVTEEVNRTEAMEQEEETMMEVEGDVEADLETSVLDTTSTLEAEVGSSQTFTETGTYLTPARTSHEMTVSLTLENGVVAAAAIVYDGGEGFSNANQERFDAAYKAEVIGKPLTEISLSRVGGASLTSQAFNEAVAKISAAQS